MGTDCGSPDRTGARVCRTLIDGVSADADAHRGTGDPLGIESVEHLAKPLVFGSDQTLRRYPDIVEMQGVLLFGQADANWQAVFDQPGASVGTRNSDNRSSPVRVTTISASASSTPEM